LITASANPLSLRQFLIVKGGHFCGGNAPARPSATGCGPSPDTSRAAVRGNPCWRRLVLLPFAFVELLGGGNVLRRLLGALLQVTDFPPEQRKGFTRVVSVFDHAILFGLHTGSIAALTYLVLGYRKSLVQRFVMTGIVVLTAATSLSAGPIGAVAAQVFLLSWNGLLRSVKARWKILTGTVICLVIVVEIVANRSAISIIAEMFVIDSQTYWYRRFIWIYGSASALEHPLFGIGLHDWYRPTWMPGDTIDNFWLVQAIRYGLPAAILLMLAGSANILTAAVKRVPDDRLNDFRTAYVITMIFFFLIGWTVHLWDSAYVLFLFLLGSSGVWIRDAGPSEGEGARPNVPPARRPLWSKAQPLTGTAMPVKTTSWRKRGEFWSVGRS
jgi:hypothetical protein